jgi:hypothetical protein
MADSMLVSGVSAVAGALVGGFGGFIANSLSSRKQRREAASALLYEVRSNRAWAEGIFESGNLLRDEAWIQMKNTGYIGYLKAPIPSSVIRTYDALHKLNERVVLRRARGDPMLPLEVSEAEARAAFIGAAVELDSVLTEKHRYLRSRFKE